MCQKNYINYFGLTMDEFNAQREAIRLKGGDTSLRIKSLAAEEIIMEQNKIEETNKPMIASTYEETPSKVSVGDGTTWITYKSTRKIPKTKQEALELISAGVLDGKPAAQIAEELGLLESTVQKIIDSMHLSVGNDENKENESMRERFEKRQEKMVHPVSAYEPQEWTEPKVEVVTDPVTEEAFNKYKLTDDEIEEIMECCYGKITYDKWKSLKNCLNYYMRRK